MKKIVGFRSGKTWKKVIATFGYLFIGLTLWGMLSGNSSTAVSPAQQGVIDGQKKAGEVIQAKADTEAKTKDDTEAKIKADTALEEQKQAVKEFNQKLLDAEKTIKPLTDKFIKATSSNDVNAAFEAASNALNECNNIRSIVNNLSIPANMPDDIKTSLKNMRENISTGYYCKSEAYKAALEYLDNNKPSSLQALKDKNKEADMFFLKYASEQYTLYKKLNIE